MEVKLKGGIAKKWRESARIIREIRIINGLINLVTTT